MWTLMLLDSEHAYTDFTKKEVMNAQLKDLHSLVEIDVASIKAHCDGVLSCSHLKSTTDPVCVFKILPICSQPVL
jgi:hypothetical protein